MADAELPGRSRLPKDLYVEDQQAFLQQIPELITRLRMRRPATALALNLSEASLHALDLVIAEVVNALPGGYSRIADAIDRDLLRQTTAYVGEVIVRNRNGRWQTNSVEPASGPKVVFPMTQLTAITAGRWKEIDIYEHVLVTILEGDTFTGWYSSEVRDGNRI